MRLWVVNFLVETNSKGNKKYLGQPYFIQIADLSKFITQNR